MSGISKNWRCTLFFLLNSIWGAGAPADSFTTLFLDMCPHNIGKTSIHDQPPKYAYRNFTKYITTPHMNTRAS